MTQYLEILDRVIQRALSVICGALLCSGVVFTVYTVVMRYIFVNPPFWGDTLSTYANTWMVLLAFGLAIRRREQISMNVLYQVIPERAGHAFQLVWSIVVLVFGVFLLVYGGQAAIGVPGQIWELGQLPKGYVMAILPITGTIVILVTSIVLIEDIRTIRRDGSGERKDGGYQ